jgi:hypothetical protein
MISLGMILAAITTILCSYAMITLAKLTILCSDIVVFHFCSPLFVVCCLLFILPTSQLYRKNKKLLKNYEEMSNIDDCQK